MGVSQSTVWVRGREWAKPYSLWEIFSLFPDNLHLHSLSGTVRVPLPLLAGPGLPFCGLRLLSQPLTSPLPSLQSGPQWGHMVAGIPSTARLFLKGHTEHRIPALSCHRHGPERERGSWNSHSWSGERTQPGASRLDFYHRASCRSSSVPAGECSPPKSHRWARLRPESRNGTSCPHSSRCLDKNRLPAGLPDYPWCPQ